MRTAIKAGVAGLSIIAGTSAYSADLGKAEELLKQKHAQQCILRNSAATESELNQANRRVMEIGSEIGKIKMGMMSDMNAQVEFAKLQSRIAGSPCASKTSRADAEQQVRDAVEDLETTLCAARAETDPVQKGIKMGSADKARRRIKDLSAELERTGKTDAHAKLESRVHAIEMGGGC